MNQRLVIPFVIGFCVSFLVACSNGDDDADPTATPVLEPTAVVATATTADVQQPTDSLTATAVVSPASTPAATETSTESPVAAEPTPSATLSSAIPEGNATVEIGDQTLSVPAGYTISIFAEGLGSARFLAVDADGALYVTDQLGRVLRLPDADGDGVADQVETVLDGLDSPHGITFHDGALYIAEESRVISAEDRDGDGSFESVETLIPDLPEGGHWSRTIRFGPDGLLYVSVGSSCNVCEEEDPLRASIWRFNADGTGGEPFAIGLRNAVGITFHPDTGELWATNNGRDGMGDDVPPETINQPQSGDDFGWPRCHAGTIIDPLFGSEGACDGVAQPSVLMQAHSAPLGLTFASGEMLAPFDGDMLVAFHGSWNRSEPTGYKVVRIPFENGQPTGEPVDFITGWLLDDGDWWGRPVDVIVANDGSLMISDDDAGRIFRLSRSE